MSPIRTPLQLESGPWAGYFVRRARKVGRCEFWKGSSAGGRCPRVIAADELYVEGECNPDKPGYLARERYCLECAGPETRAALATEEAA
jgi:hypothetical protein